MRSALDARLLVITGKGGVGKTTVAAAAGLAAARAGRRTIVVEVGEESRLPGLFGMDDAPPGMETTLSEHLSSISIDPDAALLEWLQALGGRVSGRVLASSGTFQYFAAAAPGAKELVTMVKVWRLTRPAAGPRGSRGGGYDLVVLDAPATGHALGMLGAPQTFGAIARVGPIAVQTRQVHELLGDAADTAYVAVALANEMAVTEVLELQHGLQQRLDRKLDAVVANALMPLRFTAGELDAIDSLPVSASSGDGAAAASAVAAAHAVHDRARVQRNQLARLRRRGLRVVGVPHHWGTRIDVHAVEDIARRLARRL